MLHAPDADPRDLEALDAALDALVSGIASSDVLAATSDHLDAETRGTLDTFWKDTRHATPPDPDPAFVATLRRDLLMPPTATTTVPLTTPRRRRQAITASPRRPLLTPFGAFSTALAILLVLGMILTSVLDRGGNDPHIELQAPTVSVPAIAPDATPAPDTASSADVMWGGDAGKTWMLSDTDPDLSGDLRQVRLPGGDDLRWPIVVENDLIFGEENLAAGTSQLTSIDLVTGNENWSVAIDLAGRLASDGERVFLYTAVPQQTTDGGPLAMTPQVHAFSLSTGEDLWTSDPLGGLSRVSTNQDLFLLNGTLYANDFIGDIIAINPETGTTIWKTADPFPTYVTIGTVQSQMIGFGTSIYLTTSEHELIRFDATTGEVQQTADLEEMFGSDIEAVSMQALGNELLLRLTRGNEEAGTIARIRPNDSYLLSQSPSGSPDSNLVTEDRTFVTASSSEANATRMIKQWSTDSERGSVRYDYDGTSPYVLLIGAGDSIIASEVDGTIRIVDFGTQPGTPEPDVITSFAGDVMTFTIPDVGETTGALQPLMWGDVPIFVGFDGEVWALDGGSSSDATPAASGERGVDVMWGGDAGKTWMLSDTDPDLSGAERQILARADFRITASLVVGDDLLITGSSTDPSHVTDELISIDIATGQENWSSQIRPWGTLASDGKRVFLYTMTLSRIVDVLPQLTAYDLETGNQVWIGDEVPGISEETAAYGPILLNGTLYANDAAGNVIAADPATGRIRWEYPSPFADLDGTDPAPWSRMIGQGDAIYLATSDGALVKLDAATGEVVQTANLPALFGEDMLFAQIKAGDPDHLLIEIKRGTWSDGEYTNLTGAIARLATADFSVDETFEMESFAGSWVSPGDGSAIVLAPNPDGGGRTLTRVLTPVTGNAVPGSITDDIASDAELMLAGDTILAVRTDLVTAVNLTTGTIRKWRSTSSAEDQPNFPALLWQGYPVVIHADGTVWVSDILAPTFSTDETNTLILTDDGFAATEYTLEVDDKDVATLAIDNQSTRDLKVSIPLMGVNDTIPVGQSIFMQVTARFSTYAVYVTETGPVDARFTTAINVTGLDLTTRDGITVFGLSRNFTGDVPSGTVVYARPDVSSPTIASFPNGAIVYPLTEGDRPSADEDRLITTEVDGVEWVLVLSGADTIGWIPRDTLGDITPLPTISDATPES